MKAPEVHPVADLFPMLADADLADLAADIAERGLLQPIVLDADGRILDGRNRFAACKLAKVKPTFVAYEGNDPEGYALAVNIARRHLSKGQVAMVAARASAFCGKTLRAVGAAQGVSASRLAYASTVLNYAPDLADSVVAGARPLDDAYKVAQARKKDAEGTEAKLADLRKRHPNLAEMVAEEELTLAEALAAARERDEARESARRLFVGNLVGGAERVLTALDGRDVAETLAFHLEADASAIDPELCRAAAALLDEAAAVIEKESR